MAQVYSWQFEQLAGDKKKLTLTGWSAPFGRPRHGTVVNTGVKIRESTTYIPGSNVEPDIHVFGDEGLPFNLNGRWMDQSIGIVNGAQLTARTWKDFVEDAQRVQVSWGPIVTYRIFIKELKIEWESAAECVWSMDCTALKDLAGPIVPQNIPPASPLDIVTDMQKEMATTLAPATSFALSDILNLLPDISDTLDNLVSLVNTPFAVVFNIASALTDFASATTTDLARLSGGLQEVQTGLTQFANQTDLMVSTVQVIQSQQQGYFASGGANTFSGIGASVFSAQDMTDLMSTKIASDEANTNFQALLADMENQIRAATRGNVSSVCVAQTGDTWESLAYTSMGSIDGARQLKAMNGVTDSTGPIPGRQYTVPSQGSTDN
jgi:hypothetical protein